MWNIVRWREGIFVIVADRRRGSDGDNSTFALTLTTFEFLSDII